MEPSTASQNYLLLQPMKLATSNLAGYTTWAWEVRYNNRFLVPNLVRAGWSTGAPQKLCGPGTMYTAPRNSCRNVTKRQI